MIKKELQQELNRTKLVLDYARQEIEEKDKEIERLNKRIKELEEGFKATTEDLCEESTKIDKAIRFIKETTEYYHDGVNEELIQILKGE